MTVWKESDVIKRRKAELDAIFYSVPQPSCLIEKWEGYWKKKLSEVR